ARLLRRVARGEARRTARAVAGVREFLCGEELGKLVVRRLREQSVDARDLDAVDAAAYGIGRRGRRNGGQARSARTRSAASVAGKPRQSTSATSLRGVRARCDTGSFA